MRIRDGGHFLGCLRRTIEHFELRGGGKQLLLLVLSVNFGEPRSQRAQRGNRCRAIADEDARLARSVQLAPDEDFPALNLKTQIFEISPHRKNP